MLLYDIESCVMKTLKAQLVCYRLKNILIFVSIICFKAFGFFSRYNVLLIIFNKKIYH